METTHAHLGRRIGAPGALVAACAVWAGCASAPDRAVSHQLSVGDAGEARRLAYQRVSKGKADERALDLMRLLYVTMADGYSASAEEPANQLFDLLRKQGVNADRTLAATTINEDLKRWKGEPFEQAMAYAEIASQKLVRGDWGNARAAASSSLFLLKSFDDAKGRAITSREGLAEEAAQREAKGEGGYLDHGYQPIATDFALGYALHGIASLALGRDDEASDNLKRATDLVPAWGPAADRLMSRDFDTVLIVEFGDGPARTLSGPDGIYIEWVDRTRSDVAGVSVTVGGAETERFAWIQDTNRMAHDLKWGGLSDVRQAKSLLGQGLMAGGAAVAIAGDGDAKYVGLGMMLAGLFARAGAHADARYCEVLPQRVFVAPVTVGPRGASVSMQVDTFPGSRLEIPWVPGPDSASGAPFAVRVVRLLDVPAPPAWAVAGAFRYGHDAYPGMVAGDGLPWILGGTDVRVPSHEALVRYQFAGNCAWMTTADLAELYRAEGISWDLEALGGFARGHILEGGTTLIPPDPGTTGAVRIFCGDHPAYIPRTPEVREAAARARGQATDSNGDSQ